MINTLYFIFSVIGSIRIGKLIGYWIKSLGFAGLEGLNIKLDNKKPNIKVN